jgi:gamma-glutamyl hydrolase
MTGFLIASLLLCGAAALNNRPIVGILTQPLGTEQNSSKSSTTMIAASYVKFIESAGARVVPVHYDSTDEELAALFGQINGVLLPGGGADLGNATRIRHSGQTLYDLALRANQKGDSFPIWGTCMGFQFLSLLTAQDDAILCEACFDSEGTPMPLLFAEPAASASRLYGPLTPALKHKLATENLTENSHHDGILPATFASNARLAGFYDVLSTNVDGKGYPFVSSIEAKGYPFFGTQWHPEKNNFEWGTKLGPGAIPHGADATAVSQYVADFVVAAARLSEHVFATPQAEAEALIYNWPAVPDPNGYYTQVYLFDRPGPGPPTPAPAPTLRVGVHGGRRLQERAVQHVQRAEPAMLQGAEA